MTDLPDTLNPKSALEANVSISTRRARPGRPIYESNLLPSRRRRRVSPWVVVPLLLLGLGGVLYFLVFAPRPRPNVSTAGKSSMPPRPLARALRISGLRQPTAPAAASADESGSGGDTSPTFTADGKQVAFLSNRAGGQNQIYIVDGDGKNLTQVTRTAGAKSQPAFAPGSNTLLGFLSGGTLAVTDVDKESVTLLLPAPAQSSHPDDYRPQPVSGNVLGRGRLCLEAGHSNR